MERNEIKTVCRLCLSENGNLIYVFESKEMHGLTAADAINELLRIQVSADDIYPQWVCIECMGKLEDFKIFKERCETCKTLLDRAYAAKRDTGQKEEFIEGTSSFMENHCGVYLKEEDPNIILEKDPLELTEEDKPIKLENENCVFVSNKWASREEIESANDSYMSDRNEDENTEVALETESKYLPSSLSLTALGTNEETNRDCKNILEVSDNWCLKEEVVDMPIEVDSVELLAEEERMSEHQSCNIFANEMTQNSESRSSASHCLLNRNESPNSNSTLEIFPNAKDSSYSLGCSNVARDVVELSANQEKGDILQVNEKCSNPSGNKFFIVLSGLPSTNKGAALSSGCCQSYSVLQPDIRAHGIPLHVIPAKLSRQGNFGRDLKDCRNNEDKSRSVPIGIKDPLHLHLQTTAIENEVEGARFTVIPFPKKPKEIDSEEKQSTKEEINSSTESNAASKLNRSSSKKVLQAQIHVRKKAINGTGYNIKDKGYSEMEKGKKGRLEESLEENENYFRCNYCGLCYDAKENLRNHIESHIGGELQKSKVSSSVGVVGRKQLVGPNQSIDGKCEPKFKPKRRWKGLECELCKKKFKTHENLKVHQVVHTGERPFKCGKCEKDFKDPRTLKRHMLTHTGVKQYVCVECGKEFLTRSELKCHVIVHLGEKPFKCLVCNKDFCRLKSLKSHSIVHTGQSPLCCTVCGKGFYDKRNLKRHFMCHTGEKPFECIECHKRFRSNCSLKTHLMVHQPCTCLKLGRRCYYTAHCNAISGFMEKANHSCAKCAIKVARVNLI